MYVEQPETFTTETSVELQSKYRQEGDHWREVSADEYRATVTSQAGGEKVIEVCRVDGGDRVATFAVHEKVARKHTERWVGFVSDTTLISLHGGVLEMLDVETEASVHSVPVDSGHNCCLMLGANVLIIGYGEYVEAWYLSEETAPKCLPIGEIYADGLTVSDEVEVKPATFSGSRLVAATETAFVIWSIKRQEQLAEIPYSSFSADFQPKYCGCHPGDKFYAESEDGDSYLLDLNTREVGDVPGDFFDHSESDGESEISASSRSTYFTDLVDLGGGVFASLPSESTDGTLVQVWDISQQTLICSIPYGVEGVDEVKRDPEDADVLVINDELRWNLKTGKKLSDPEDDEHSDDYSAESDGESSSSGKRARVGA